MYARVRPVSFADGMMTFTATPATAAPFASARAVALEIASRSIAPRAPPVVRTWMSACVTRVVSARSPTNASTTLAVVAVGVAPVPAPRPDTATATVVALEAASPSALTTSVVAFRLLPSPAYARVVALALAVGTITVIVTRAEAPPPSVLAVASTSDRAPTRRAPLMSSTAPGAPPRVRPEAAPMNASTAPFTTASALAPAPAPTIESWRTFDVASASYRTRSVSSAGVAGSSRVPAWTVSEPASMFTPSRTYARVVPLTVAVGSMTPIDTMPAKPPLSAVAFAFMYASAVTPTAPSSTSMSIAAFAASLTAFAPMYASTIPATVAVELITAALPNPAMLTVCASAMAFMVGAFALIVSEPASMSTPSPTNARVVPEIVPISSRFAMLTPPANAAAVTVGVAVIDDLASIEMALACAFTFEAVGVTSSLAAPMCASTMPLTTASALATDAAPRPPTPTETVEAVAVYVPSASMSTPLSASTSAPSPMYARVAPATSACGFMAVTVRPADAPPPSALAVAVIVDQASMSTRPLTSRIVASSPPGTIPTGAPTNASTTPSIVASARTPDPLAMPLNPSTNEVASAL